jgi:hypothetical protein
MPTILITGAAGSIGTMLRSRLARPGRVLRLLDLVPLAAPAGPGEEPVTASVTDMAAMTAACAGADAVIHLGGVPTEDAWAPILDVNINGTYTVFEAARRAGVPRVVFASSNHAVGFTPRESFPVTEDARPVPDTYYGVSKAAGEALAALYALRYGMDAICVRILSCFARPLSARMLATWLSPDDAGRLFEACLAAPGCRAWCSPRPTMRSGSRRASHFLSPTMPAPRPTPTTASPRRPARPWPASTRVATAWTRSASGSCPASTGR